MSDDRFLKKGEALYTDFNVELFAELNEIFDVRELKVSGRPSTDKIEARRKFEFDYSYDQVELLARNFDWDNNPPERVLEFGCGSGFVANYIKETYPSVEVVCTEIESHHKWADYPDITFHEIDIVTEDCEFLGQFDYIVSCVVFEHVRLPWEALEALKKLLKPGGRLYFSSCLWRGWTASHRWNEVFFPWPHLLFKASVFNEYYGKYLGIPPGVDTVPSWVNGMTPAHYRDYFRQLNLEVSYLKFTSINWDERVEELYQRFHYVLSRYSKEDLEHDMMYVVVRKENAEDDALVTDWRGISKITWDPVPEATSYRVLIRDDTIDSVIEKTIIDDTEYQFDWDLADWSHPFRCKIQYRTGEKDEWKEARRYVPLVAPRIKQRLLGGNVSRGKEMINWDAVSDAVSYRLLIRNDTVDEVTDKIIVNDNEYELDWDERDATARQRFRVQYRISESGEWIDYSEYVYLSPPPLIVQ
jgi:SAM-dependent methyltransferase